MRGFLRYLFVVAAMLMVVVGDAWAGKVKLVVNSSPFNGGYVYANKENKNNIGTLTSDYAESDYKVGGSVSMYRFAKAADGYEFKGWADNDNGTPNSFASEISLGAAIGTSTKTYTYYAIFAPITYTIAFNGNGSTSGAMDNISMVYNTTKNLTVNAFARQYTVTYNADGGTCGVGSEVAIYTFVGWEDRNSMVYNGKEYTGAEFDAPYYANTYGDLYNVFGYNKYNLLQHYVNNGKGENRSPIGSVRGVYPNNASVSNLSTKANETVTLYAQWQSASVVLPTATKAGAVIEGWYIGGVKVGEPGDSYTPTGNVTLTAKWIEKYTPEIIGANYNLMVGGEQLNAFSFKYTDNPTAHIDVVSISDVNDGSGNVISYDAVNNKIIAHNAGEATIYFTQAETETIKAGSSAKYKVIVSKFNNTLAIAANSYTKYVDDVITNIVSSVNSDATVTTISTDATIAYYDVANNRIVIPNSEAKSFSSQAITITIAQAETHKYTAAEKTIALTINKYTPAFTWNASNTPYYFGTSIPNVFSTTNTDFGYTIVSDNEYVAKVIDNTLHIYNVEETANITVTQVENYKWNGKIETYTITPVEVNNHVTFTYTQEMFNDGTITTQKVAGKSYSWEGNGVKLESGATDWADKYVVIRFEGIPKDISFKYKASDNDVSNGWTEYRQADWYIAEGAEGPNGEIIWSSTYPWSNMGGENSNSTSWISVSNKPLQSTTRYLKLCYSGNFAGFYSEITVTELEKFDASPKPLDFGKESVNKGEQEKQVVFEHANAGRETKVTIEGADADYFSVSPTTISNTGHDLYGTTYLNVTFDNETMVRGDQPYTATLVIEDNAGHREEIELTGVRNGKATPVFTWNPNNFPYYFNTSIANIVISSNTDYANCPLTITSSNENIAKVENGRLYIYNQSGEVTFTVTQQGNDTYYEHTESFTFTPKVKPDLTVPFQVTQEIYNQAMTVGDNCSWDGDDHQVKLGNGAWDDTRKTAILVFSGIPDKLTFTYATSYNLAVIEIGSFDNPKWEVEESSDGDSWNSIWSVKTNSTNWTDVEIPLSETTQYVRFSYDGNYAGYFKNINISELVGYKYLRAADGHYLSRGGKWGTQAVMDAFGVVSRISNYTRDNENEYTRFFFVDNEQYMFETETEDEQRLHEIFTDNGTAANTNHLWQINNDGGVLTIQSANEVGAVSHKGDYITAINGVLAFTKNEAEATRWQMEDYTEHLQYIDDMLHRQVAEAAVKDFGKDINTLEKVRNRLKEEDFEAHDISIEELQLGEQTGEGRTIDGMPYIYEQIITGVDTGFYRLTVKALYRISNSEIAWRCNQEKGKESVLAYAYANNVQFPIQSVYASYHSSAIENTDEFHNGKFYSTTLTSVDVAFDDANRYLNDVYVYVAPDPGKTTGTLHYGIKSPSYVPGAWLAYADITLTRFARKEFIFECDDSQNPGDWNTSTNWNRDEVPNKYHRVTIKSNANIALPFEVYSLSIEEGKKVHITSSGGLTIGNGGVLRAKDEAIVLENTPEGAGYLRIDPSATNKLTNKVEVKYTTKAFDGVWQYFGAPGTNATISNEPYTDVYLWSEPQGWLQHNSQTLQPFEGYALTQYNAEKATYSLTATPICANQTIHLTKTAEGMNGDNLFVNSYLAPIDLTKFTDMDDELNDPNDDFRGDFEKTFYLFNSGSWEDWQDNGGSENNGFVAGNERGQYFAITPLSVKLLDSNIEQTVIPSMQGVYVIANENGASIKLDYNKHVYKADAANMNYHMRAPKVEDKDFMRVRMQVGSQNSGADRMYVIQYKEGTRGFDNGYDAKNILADGLANIYTSEQDGQMEISVSDNIDETYIGFVSGNDSEYTLRFTSVVGELYLKDLETETVMAVMDGEEYTFHAEPNSVNDRRFLLLDHMPEQGGVSTSVDNLSCIKAWIADNVVYVTNAPINANLVVYTMSGVVVTSSVITTPYATIDLANMPSGVYMLHLNDKVYKFVCK